MILTFLTSSCQRSDAWRQRQRDEEKAVLLKLAKLAGEEYRAVEDLSWHAFEFEQWVAKAAEAHPTKKPHERITYAKEQYFALEKSQEKAEAVSERLRSFLSGEGVLMSKSVERKARDADRAYVDLILAYGHRKNHLSLGKKFGVVPPLTLESATFKNWMTNAAWVKMQFSELRDEIRNRLDIPN